MTYEYDESISDGERCYIIRMDGDVVAQSYLEENAQHVTQELNEAERLRAEVERLRQRLLTAAGDDLCRFTQEEIKAMSAGGVPIPPKEEFLASCERFHAQVAGAAGVNQNCLTLAQLIAEVERLRAATKALLALDEIKYSSHGAVFAAAKLVEE